MPRLFRKTCSANRDAEEVGRRQRTLDEGVTPAQLRFQQGSSHPPWGSAWVVKGTRPEETRQARDWLPRRALVLGLARSGRAAALALARRGVEVLAADRSAAADPGRLADA